MRSAILIKDGLDDLTIFILHKFYFAIDDREKKFIGRLGINRINRLPGGMRKQFCSFMIAPLSELTITITPSPPSILP